MSQDRTTEHAIAEVLLAAGVTGLPDEFAVKVEGRGLEQVRHITRTAVARARAAGRYLVWHSDFDAALADAVDYSDLLEADLLAARLAYEKMNE